MMHLVFLAVLLLVTVVIWRTGAFQEGSSHLHDMVGFVLLALIIWVLAIIFTPYVEPPGPPNPCYLDCVVVPMA